MCSCIILIYYTKWIMDGDMNLCLLPISMWASNTNINNLTQDNNLFLHFLICVAVKNQCNHERQF